MKPEYVPSSSILTRGMSLLFPLAVPAFKKFEQGIADGFHIMHPDIIHPNRMMRYPLNIHKIVALSRFSFINITPHTKESRYI
jgi:hypothetical protein